MAILDMTSVLGRWRRLWLLLLCLACFLPGLGQAASEQTALCVQSEALSGDAPKAQRLYLSGECALERHEYRQAVVLFQELVGLDSNPIFHAELGRAYLGAQEFERARAEFLSVLAGNPPEPAKKLLRVFLQMADQQQTQAKTWFATAAVGLQYDSNVNTGSVSSQTTFYGLPFTLAPESMPKSDGALRGTFSVVHAKPLSGVWSWQSNANLDMVRHHAYRQYDTDQVILDTGPHLAVLDGQADFYLLIGLARALLGGAGYTLSRTVSPQLSYMIGQSDLAMLSVPLARKTYDNAPAMNSTAYALAPSWRHILPGAWTLEPSLRYGVENAADDAFSNKVATVGLALRGSLADIWRLNVEANYSRARYRAAESWADSPRQDSRINYQLALSRNMERGYYLTLSLLRMRIVSNLALYASERTQMQVQLSKGF